MAGPRSGQIWVGSGAVDVEDAGAGIGGRVKPGLLLDPQRGPTFKAAQRDGGAAFGIRRGIGGAIDHPPPEISP